MASYKEVLGFWFDEDHVDLHFAENKEFDEKIREKFLETWEKGKEGLLVGWRTSPQGRLAEIIVLDQFSRNLFRNDIRTYTQDKMAIALSQELILSGAYDELTDQEKAFVLLPFMHSESLELHDWARQYFEDLGGSTYQYELMHREVLEEFGRYPYQNQDLGRESTEAEKKALEENKDGFYS